MWYYNGKEINSLEEFPEDVIGFVYDIKNLVNGRRYIGKKILKTSKTKIVSGKKKRTKVESDWKNYYGSNEELKDDVKKFGKENFKRNIVRFCISKGEMSYIEAKLQFENNVLESNFFYNTWIMCRIHKKHLTFLKKDKKLCGQEL